MTDAAIVDAAETEGAETPPARPPVVRLPKPVQGALLAVFRRRFMRSAAKRYGPVFEINVPFATDLARSAADPARPKSHLGIDTEPFHLDLSEIDPTFSHNPLADFRFERSYGDPQPVDILARNELRNVAPRRGMAGCDSDRGGGRGNLSRERRHASCCGAQP